MITTSKKSFSLGPWLSAMRLRTLPLALASIGLGSFLAAYQGAFNIKVLLLSALTTVFLQILSNLANDYGDTQHGADSKHREGPPRSVQSGTITSSVMRKAMTLFGVLSFTSGLLLIYVALGFNLSTFLFFLILGVLCIAAAIAYTAGKKPYGYAGLGDLSVMIFFGLVGVLGTFYLHTSQFDAINILPALSSGFFATAVLNVNNIRDIKSDKLAGKKSIPVRLGKQKAVIYHWILLTLGFLSAFIYTCLIFESYWQFLYFISIPLILKNGLAISEKDKAVELDPYLKQMAITTLVFVLSFGIGLLLG